jgi:hypothetical protein
MIELAKRPHRSDANHVRPALIERHAGEPIDDPHSVFAVGGYSRGAGGRS